MNSKILVFIPTYNEIHNVTKIYELIRELNDDFSILFLDDNSPDGTGALIDNLCEKDPRVFVIHRRGKLGVGSAHLDGINWAYNNGFKTLITMDCDLTHSPEHIPLFLEKSENCEVVIGSRYMNKDSLATWNLFRKTLTHTGHLLTRIFLGMSYDASGAFRLYKLEKIPKEFFALTRSISYSFFFESLFILHFNSFLIKEIPIDLPSRTYGNSKMSLFDMWTSIKHLFMIYFRKRFRKESLSINLTTLEKIIE